jgi:activator of 2-hydroxyglutaryl-CoA dehydratase
MSYTIGLDGGSTYLKGALLKDRQVVETMVCSTGIDNNGSAEQMLGQLCQKAGISRSDIRYTMATGYSRKVLTVADDDITAHAYGVRVRTAKSFTWTANITLKILQ